MRVIKPSDVIRAVLEVWEVSSRDLTASRRRSRYLSEARTAAAILMRQYVGLSYPEIASRLGIDQTSVVYALNKERQSEHFKARLEAARQLLLNEEKEDDR